MAGGARGLRFGALPPGLLERLPAWLATGQVEGGQVLKAPRVWRFERWAVKLSDPTSGLDLRAALRRSPAERAALAALSIRPIRTPEPLVALARRRGLGGAQSILVMEFVAGRPLHELIADEPRAARAFPRFMAAMHRHGVFHGDFHPHNSLWNGREWVLLDLEGLRRGLRAFPRQRLAERQWARMLFNMANYDPANLERIERLYRTYAKERCSRTPERDWERVRELALSALDAHRARRASPA